MDLEAVAWTLLGALVSALASVIWHRLTGRDRRYSRREESLQLKIEESLQLKIAEMSAAVAADHVLLLKLADLAAEQAESTRRLPDLLNSLTSEQSSMAPHLYPFVSPRVEIDSPDLGLEDSDLQRLKQIVQKNVATALSPLATEIELLRGSLSRARTEREKRGTFNAKPRKGGTGAD